MSQQLTISAESYAKLEKMGEILSIKANLVFVLLIRNKKGFNLGFFKQISEAVPEVILKYPTMEMLSIKEDLALLVLKQK
jgi:hypothetical protein